MNRSVCRGFSLTELLVVLALVGALAAIVLPVGRWAVGRSRAAGCLSNLRQIGIGLEAYLQDNNQILPELAAGRQSRSEDLPVLDTVLAGYLPGRDVFRCPADREVFEESGCSYLWNTTQNGRHRTRLEFFGEAGEAARIPLVTDKEAWHPGDPGVNFLYADLSASTKVQFTASP